MYIQKEMYNGHEVDILYPEEGYLLQHKVTHLIYGSVSLEDGRKQEDYDEIKVESPEEPEEDSVN